MYTNEYYDLDYDPAKNQINWKVKGFWESVDVVPNMEQNWDTALERAKKPGFNILADLTEMKLPPQDVQDLHAKIQGKIIGEGVHKVATINLSTLTTVSVRNITTESGMVQMVGEFNDTAGAQAWLDEA